MVLEIRYNNIEKHALSYGFPSNNKELFVHSSRLVSVDMDINLWLLEQTSGTWLIDKWGGRGQCMECLCDKKYGSWDAKVKIDNREWVIPSG